MESSYAITGNHWLTEADNKNCRHPTEILSRPISVGTQSGYGMRYVRLISSQLRSESRDNS